ncbi:glycoside hydrolase family 78 protein [Paenibacillus sp. CAU 1782]
MWWYAAFSVNFQAMTYRYQDKQLIVEWQSKDADQITTKVNVRHMVRVGPTGTYAKAAESIIPKTYLPSQLPATHTENPDSSHGRIIGRNVSYSGYSTTVSSGGAITATLNSTQKEAYISFFYEVDPPSFTGDFDIVPNTINYRESFSFVPKNFQMNACVYQSHKYKIDRNGTYTTVALTGGQSQVTSYSYSSYPWVIGVGTHTVSINIKTNCGETGWINPKPLVVKDMAGNRPPEFQIGFVYPGQPTVPLKQVVEGTRLNLIFIEDPNVPTPFDPDGDSLHFMGFDTEGSVSNFIRALPSKYSEYTNGFHNVLMDELGYHYVSAQMRDQWGLTATASTWIQVVPKNPVAVPKGPTTVKSGRPVDDKLFDSKASYSPAGRTINHARDEWINKKTEYINESDEDIFENVQLHVYDSEGLKSLQPGNHTLIVEPDLPPIAKLDVPSLAVRNQEMEIINRSYSPDGDEIVKTEYRYKYDAKNNGFEDDEWVTLIVGSHKGLPFKPTKVGKYLFYVKVTEDYGRWADTLDEQEDMLVMDVINDSPTIAFDMEGKNEQPDLEPLNPYLPADMLKKWKLFGVNCSAAMKFGHIKWFANGNVLAGSTGKTMENQRNQSVALNANGNYYSFTWMSPFAELGFGTNSLSPYRAIANVDSTKTQLLLNSDNKYLQPQSANVYVRTNESHFYYGGMKVSAQLYSDYNTGRELYAFNKSKIGRYKEDFIHGQYDVSLALSYPDGTPVDFRLGPKELYNRSIKSYSYPSYADYLAKTNGTVRKQSVLHKYDVRHYEVADRTIYQIVSFQKYDDQRDTYIQNGRETTGPSSGLDLRTYDAFTGELIASTLEDNLPDQISYNSLYVKGDNLLAIVGSIYYEWNREGKLIATYTLPDLGITVPSWQYEMRTKHAQFILGDLYLLTEVGHKDAPRYGQNTYLSKVDSNFKLAWTVQLKGAAATLTDGPAYGSPNTPMLYPNIIYDPSRNEVLVNSFTNTGWTWAFYYQRINAVTGSASDFNTTDYGTWNSEKTDFSLNWNGLFKKNSNNSSTYYPYTQTADGWSTGSDGISALMNYHNPIGAKISSNSLIKLTYINMFGGGNTGLAQNGLYVGDGLYLSFNESVDTHNAIRSAFLPVLSVGTPTTDPLLFDAFTLGQFVSDNKLSNAELAFTMKLHQPKTNTKLAGMSFRMQNPLNRYAVETDGQKLYLSKYTGGNRTVLGSQNFPVQSSKGYNFRILMRGETIKVYMDNVPYFEVTDSQFSDGYFGMFADRGLVDFEKVGSKDLPDADEWDTQYAIWEEADGAASIRTDNVIFEDPENDPIAELDWSIFHTVRFINNQGQSALHGQSIREGELMLDNVGDYKVALRGRDDPNPRYSMPDMTFDEYRKNSNEFVRMITVHRRPVAEFKVEKRERDGQVLWTDYSYDPDRYESATHFSDEDTGIDYKATKGIMEKRFYYITPSGQYVAEKLITPQEKGTYEVGLAVKDEYGAWSNWAVQMLEIDKLPPPNTPPTPGFTKTHVTTYRGVNVTIDSTASDLEDGDRTNLPHTYYVRNKTTNGAESIRSTSRTNWTINFDKLGTYNIRQVVQDSHGATAQAEQEINIVNRKPAANLTYPTSTNQNSPTKVTVLRPEFTWTYSDPDNDAQSRYQVQIYRYGGVLLLDSGSRDGADKAWTASADLPEKTNMYVQVRVHDGFEWSDWSTVRYFYIETNQPPTADFSWSPQPVYEGDTVQFRSNVSDPDRDLLSVSYELSDPSGKKTTYRYSFQATGTTYPSTAPNVVMTQTGDWVMKITVSDGKAEPVSRSKTVKVLPLSLTGAVHHTALWNEHRQNYNKKQSGNAESPRGYEVFWAGEKFILEATTTATGTNTKADKVEVTFGKYRTELKSLQSGGSKWQGELWDSAFEKLENGTYRFGFAVYYSNGIIKTDSVEVKIQGNASGIAGVHRVQ